MTIRVLLADDQELLRQGFKMILDVDEGIEVVGEAGDGLAAVEMAASYRPDVVVMDIRMPILDGIEATSRIVARPAPEPRQRAMSPSRSGENV